MNFQQPTKLQLFTYFIFHSNLRLLILSMGEWHSNEKNKMVLFLCHSHYSGLGDRVPTFTKIVWVNQAINLSLQWHHLLCVTYKIIFFSFWNDLTVGNIQFRHNFLPCHLPWCYNTYIKIVSALPAFTPLISNFNCFNFQVYLRNFPLCAFKRQLWINVLALRPRWSPLNYGSRIWRFSGWKNRPLSKI